LPFLLTYLLIYLDDTSVTIDQSLKQRVTDTCEAYLDGWNQSR